MTDTERAFQNKIAYLAQKSFERDRCEFTDFLSVAEQELYFMHEDEVSYASPVLFGGYDGAERKLLGFSTGENLEKFPICTLEIAPKSDKFSDELTHRDFLGALVNLGVERSVIGDIVLYENRAYVFVVSRMAEFIERNLTKVKHTDIMIKRYVGSVSIKKRSVEEKVFVSSLRIDAFISAVFSLSREQSETAVKEKKVFLNGKLCEKQTKLVNVGDKITLRGKGRCEFSEIVGESKKGRLCLSVKKDE